MVAPPTGPAERRIVSVLFADLSGSTGVAESLDPEDWAELAGIALREMSAATERFGGTVARLMGDGILALFGAPVASEDDAERALRAGWAMIEVGPALRRRATELGATLTDSALLVRVGVDTGDVVAGTVGTATASEYTVLGDTANVAARLEKMATPGAVFATMAVVDAAGPSVVADTVGDISVDGRTEPVPVVRLTGFRQVATGRTTTLIGRDAEWDLLKSVPARLARGRGVVAAILGEAGLGKSALLAQLIDEAASHRVIRASPASYDTGAAFGLARALLHAFAAESSAPAGWKPVLDVLEGEEGQVDPTIVAAAVDTVVREAVARGESILFALDDLHWADHASIEVIGTSLVLAERHPVAFVWAARPYRQSPAWSLKQLAESDYPHIYQELQLGALSRDASLALARRDLSESVDESRLVQVVERAEGNPYFLGELVRELGSGQESFAVPTSLRRLVQARTDRLSDSARRVLETAAVAGRQFDRTLVERVNGGEVDGELHELAREGLVEPEGGDSYRFRHSLTQEAAYDSILGRRRRQIHSTIGSLLAEDGATPQAHLAEHFTRASEPARAAVHWLAAGNEAARLGAFADACRHFQRGLDLVDSSDPTWGRLVVGRGRARDVIGDLDGARQDLEAGLSFGEASGDDEVAWMAATALGEAWAAHDYSRAGDAYRHALVIARRRGDDHAIAVSLNRLGNWYANVEDPGEGIARHTEALEIFERLEDEQGKASTHDLLGMANMLGGDPADARIHFGTALDGFRRLGDVRGQIGALIGSAIGAPLYELMSDPPFLEVDHAEPLLDQATELATSVGWASGEVFARFMRCQLMGMAGRLGEALAEGRRALEVSRRIGHEQWIIASLQSLASVSCDALANDDANRLVSEARGLCERVGSKNWALHVAAVSGVVAIRSREPGEALRLLAGPTADPAGARFAAHRLCTVVQAWAYAEIGEEATALRILAPWADSDVPLALLARGRALRRSRPDDARATFEGGAELANRWGMRSLEWRLWLEAAAVGSPGAGDRARAVFAHCAATLDGESERRMRQMGATLFAAVEGDIDGMV